MYSKGSQKVREEKFNVDGKEDVLEVSHELETELQGDMVPRSTGV